MKQKKFLVLVCGFCVLSIVLSAAALWMSFGSETPALQVVVENESVGFTVEDLVENSAGLDGAVVTVCGVVSSVGEDYVSNRGGAFQQFYISDGTGELKVFSGFGVGRPRLSVVVGQEVLALGKVEIFNNEVELTEVELV